MLVTCVLASWPASPPAGGPASRPTGQSANHSASKLASQLEPAGQRLGTKQGQLSQSSLEVGSRGVGLLFRSRDEQTFDRNRLDPSEVKQIGQVRCQNIVNGPCSSFQDRKSAMFEFPKSKIGHVRFHKIEHRTCPTPQSPKTAIFDATGPTIWKDDIAKAIPPRRLRKSDFKGGL